MIVKHKDKRKYNNFGYYSTKFWLKGNDRGVNLGYTLRDVIYEWYLQRLLAVS